MGLRMRVLMFALFLTISSLGNITQFSMNTMLPAINADLAIDGTLSQWLATAYIMTVGIFVPVAPFLFKTLGPKKTLLTSAVVMALGSAIDCVAPTFSLILLGRVLQAAATGITTPIMQTVAVAWFDSAIRGRMLGITGLVMGFAGSFGPTAGGFCCEFWGWRSYFVALTVVATLVALLTVFVPKPQLEKASVQVPEPLSLTLSTLSFSLILFGFSNASVASLASVDVLVPICAGAALLAAFLLRQRSIERPLIHLDVFKTPSYTCGFIALCGASLSFMGTSLALPLYVQDCLGGSASDAALVMLPASIVTIFINYIAGSLVDRFGERPASLGFGTILLVGSFLALTYNASSSLAYVAAVQMVRSIGMAGIIAPMLSYALAQLPKDIMPDGSSFMVVCRQVSAAIGTSCMASAILAVPAAGNPAFPYWVALLISAVVAAGVFASIFIGVKKGKRA